MSLAAHLAHPTVIGAMLAPALLMAATGSLLISANARLSRVVDRLRSLVVSWEHDAPDRAVRDAQITEHRRRAALVLGACRMLYVALACFIGTSLALAGNTLFFVQLGVVATTLAVIGMAALLGASVAMGREVSLAVKSFDKELDQELARRTKP
jgi:protein-S-isoprenylcysteine O-methyltransferase Ste14